MRRLDAVALAARLPPSPRTRYAPSPTGYLHLGHVANAVAVWGLARALGGRVLLRLETHDRGRCRPAYERAILDDLAWLGFEPDEGPVDQADPAPYQHALDALRDAGLVYACTCSRRDWTSPDGTARYTGRCRDRHLEDAPGRALRLRVEPGLEAFPADDGTTAFQEASSDGDIILRDRDGQWSYHLAVTVDDLRQQVDLVVRGADLVEATGVQVRLARLLGRPAPAAFVHHGLVRAADGRKLSKSHGDTGVRELRAGGASAADIIGLAARHAGFTTGSGPLPAREVARMFERRPGGPGAGPHVLG